MARLRVVLVACAPAMLVAVGRSHRVAGVA